MTNVDYYFYWNEKFIECNFSSNIFDFFYYDSFFSNFTMKRNRDSIDFQRKYNFLSLEKPIRFFVFYFIDLIFFWE